MGRRPAACVRLLLLLAWIIAGGLQARAAHVLGGNITYTCLGGNNYQVNLDLFYDCTGVAALPQTLNFTSACGTQSITVPAPVPVEVSQICPSQLPNSSCNGGALQGVNLYGFQTTVNLPPCPGGWLISWVSCCRASTLNVVGAPGTYLEAELRNDLAPCTDSPQFAEHSVPYICVGEEFNFNFGVTAAPGQSLLYSLIGARGFASTSAPVTYQAGFSGAMPVPGTTIDPFSGQISFTPGAIGKYVFVVQVDQYDANGVFIGSVMRDIMLIAMPCTSVPPVVQGFASLSGPTDGVLYIGNNIIEVCHGAPFCFDLVFTDPDAGDALSISSQAATLLPGSTVTVTGTNPMTVTVCWTGDVAHSPVNLLMQVNDGACPVINTSTVGVTITSVTPPGGVPDAGADASIQVCPTALVFDLIDELGGTPDAGGFWLAPDLSFHGPQFNPASDPPGTYAYIAGNACANDTALLTIAFTASFPDAGTNGTLDLCGNAAAVPLFSGLGGTPDPGGSWTVQGTGAPVGPAYDPALHAPAVFVYTVPGVAGCAAATATVTVSEQAPADAGTNGNLTVCDQGASTSLFAALNGTPDAGGTWSGPSAVAGGMYDPATMNPGVYTYTVTGIAPCSNTSATVTVAETGSPDAGNNGAVTVCSDGAAINLFAALGGTPDAGGTWSGGLVGGMFDPAVNTAGTYTYTLAATAPCAGAQADVLVTISNAPDAGTNSALTVCDQGAATSLFAALNGTPDAGGMWSGPSGVAGGMYDPATMNPGVYTYTVTGIAPCSNTSATVTVAETGSPDAGNNGAVTVCSDGAAINLFAALGGTPDAGGTWSGGLVGGMFDPAVNPAGTYTYTLAAIAPCAGASATVTVTISNAPDAGTNATLTVCDQGASTSLFAALNGTPDAGGTWSGPSAVAGGMYDPATMNPGVYTYTVTGIAPCSNTSATVTVAETGSPDAGAGNAVALCSTGAPVNLIGLLTGTPQAGGSWTGPDGGVLQGTVDPAIAVSGSYTYTVAGTAPCLADVAVVLLTISQAVDAGSDATATLCSSDPPLDLFNLLGGTPGTGGSWTQWPNGTPVSGILDPSTAVSGTYHYRLSAVAPCPSDSAAVVVTMVHSPDAGTGSMATLCSSDMPFSLATMLAVEADPGGTWLDPAGNVAAATFDPASTLPGTYSYILPAIGDCAGDTAIFDLGVVPAAVAGSGTDTSACSNAEPFNLAGLLVGSPDAGGVWTGPDGAAMNGMFDPATGQSGAYLYTVTAPAPCPAATASIGVEVLAQPAIAPAVTVADGCAPVLVTFASGYNGDGNCQWDLGNGDVATGCGPLTVVYSVPGNYVVGLTVDHVNGCSTTAIMGQTIAVVESPVAAFQIGAITPAGGIPTVALLNESTGANAYQWDLGDLGSSTMESPMVTLLFGQEAEYTICLTAFASPGCIDSACAQLVVPASASVLVPNAFTPDGDGRNETFGPVVVGLDPGNYQFLIVDRWGHALFSTDDLNARWDGTSTRGGPVPQGVYVWKLTAQESVTKQRFERTGHVTLLR